MNSNRNLLRGPIPDRTPSSKIDQKAYSYLDKTILVKFWQMSHSCWQRSLDKELTEGMNVSEGGKINVCRKNSLGNTSNRWFHDVYFTLLLCSIYNDIFRKDGLL